MKKANRLIAILALSLLFCTPVFADYIEFLGSTELLQISAVRTKIILNARSITREAEQPLEEIAWIENSSSAFNLNNDPDFGQIGPKFDLGITRRPLNLGKTLFDTSLISLTALHVADFLSTREAVKIPGLREANPLYKSIVKNDAAFAAVKVGFAALTYIGFKGLYKKNKTTAWIMSVAANALFAYVVTNNYKFIQAYKQR